MVGVAFDKPLMAGVLDVANWRDLSEPAKRTPISAGALGTQVHLVFSAQPQNGVQFSPPPFDLIGANGRAVQGFVILFS